MERKTLMEAVAARALDYRIGLSALCKRAGVSRTIAARWERGTGVPKLPTIKKLEDEMAALEATES